MVIALKILLVVLLAIILLCVFIDVKRSLINKRVKKILKNSATSRILNHLKNPPAPINLPKPAPTKPQAINPTPHRFPPPFLGSLEEEFALLDEEPIFSFDDANRLNKYLEEKIPLLEEKIQETDEEEAKKELVLSMLVFKYLMSECKKYK